MHPGNVDFVSGSTVFKLDQSGVLTRVAGNSRTGYSGDGGAALNAELSYPEGLAVDGAGNLFIADWTRVRKVSFQRDYHHRGGRRLGRIFSRWRTGHNRLCCI